MTARGEVAYQRLSIQVGSRWNGATVRIVEINGLIHIYHADELIRALAPDRTKRIQPLGRPNRALAFTTTQ